MNPIENNDEQDQVDCRPGECSRRAFAEMEKELPPEWLDREW